MPTTKLTPHMCSVEGCGSPVKARGWCAKHWNRWRRNGHPTSLPRAKLRPGCSASGCTRPRAARGLCRTHYSRWQRSHATSICAIDGCGRPLEARGLCSRHYGRLLRHGDPLVLLNTEFGEPARYLREVVLPYNGDDCLIWPFNCGSNGYAMIWCNGRPKHVHTIVCEHEHGPKPTPKHEVAHGCRNGRYGCVTARHLRWATHIENKADDRRSRKRLRLWT